MSPPGSPSESHPLTSAKHPPALAEVKEAAPKNCVEKMFRYPYAIVATLFMLIGVENLIQAYVNNHAAASPRNLQFHFEALHPHAHRF